MSSAATTEPEELKPRSERAAPAWRSHCSAAPTAAAHGLRRSSAAADEESATKNTRERSGSDFHMCFCPLKGLIASPSLAVVAALQRSDDVAVQGFLSILGKTSLPRENPGKSTAFSLHHWIQRALCCRHGGFGAGQRLRGRAREEFGGRQIPQPSGALDTAISVARRRFSRA